MTKKLLALLNKDPRLTNATLAKIIGTTEKKVAAEIEKLLQSGEIVGFKTVLNSNQNSDNEVTAMVEVRVTTIRDRGFDKIAERIAQFPEVLNLYLISGSHDLNVLVKGKTLQEVANFVASKLAVLENVNGTRTQFLLKKYKENGLIFDGKKVDQRLKVTA